MRLATTREVAVTLSKNHYLGPTRRGWALISEQGVLVFANPSSRRLPHDTWLELVRWCLKGEANAGSKQWKVAKFWLRKNLPHITTVVSYSDPSAGHDGTLYRACNWLWAPTWVRLRPPPSRGGSWDGETVQEVKDRWVFPLRADANREGILAIQDESIVRRMPWSEYREGIGGDYRRWKRECAESIVADAPANHAGEGGSKPTSALPLFSENAA
jgi:hypothetical protein